MKRIVLIVIILLTLTTGCKEEKINYLKADWTLDQKLKPNITFERSNPNDSYGVFYVDSQITFEQFKTYLKTLEENDFKVDWRYSDANSISKLEENYKDKQTKDNIFADGYINYKMCKEDICLFMQWVDKDTYNTLNKDKPTSYSFKLETEGIPKEEKTTK